ncbi:MAG: septal ring lytic transglycosylase RlpA family protein [Rubrivivax sp.]|nr:septal ring lytic transglycosylase RlpA family protein [Rubrivivax sp.]
MPRDTSPGARLRGTPVSGSAHRPSARRLLCLGALWLAAGPLAAQTVSLNTSTPAVAEPCSSAKAVHDMRCPNYTGFKPRVGGLAGARAPAGRAADDVAEGLALPERRPLGLRGGRDLQRGMASWYGPGFHGRLTASGERFDQNDLTAAHKTLPFGTRVLVHSPRTGKQVVVRINDRGPFVRGRVIDLSKAAARMLGLHALGHDAVVLRELTPDAGDQAAAADRAG